jgi:Uma2 family endonuclease
MSVSSQVMTTEELLAMPDDGIVRDLIRGELRESPMTTRSGPHCIAMANLAVLLGNWHRAQPRPRGRLYVSDARARLRRNPDTFIGADIAYINAEQAARNSPKARFIDEPPLLAVEIASPSDTAEDMAEKVQQYLDAGVALVWEVNPFFRTVTVHRPDARPALFNDAQVLTAEPHLPGFQAAVADVFED